MLNKMLVAGGVTFNRLLGPALICQTGPLLLSSFSTRSSLLGGPMLMSSGASDLQVPQLCSRPVWRLTARSYSTELIPSGHRISNGGTNDGGKAGEEGEEGEEEEWEEGSDYEYEDEDDSQDIAYEEQDDEDPAGAAGDSPEAAEIEVTEEDLKPYKSVFYQQEDPTTGEYDMAAVLADLAEHCGPLVDQLEPSALANTVHALTRRLQLYVPPVELLEKLEDKLVFDRQNYRPTDLEAVISDFDIFDPSHFRLSDASRQLLISEIAKKRSAGFA